MDWQAKLCGQSITHAHLDSLGISVENIRKTKGLNSNGLNKYSYRQIAKRESKESNEDGFILKDRR